MPNQRGAPIGNNNAFKHGFYSQAYKAARRIRVDAEGAREQGECTIDAASLRQILAACLEKLKHRKTMSVAEILATQRTATLAVHALCKLIRTQKQIQAAQASMQAALAGLETLDPKGD